MTDKTETPATTTMLYRAGDTVNPEAWNLKLDTRIVEDGDIAAAQAEGWLTAEEATKPAKADKAATKPA